MSAPPMNPYPYGYETWTEKFSRKFKENPWVPAGASPPASVQFLALTDVGLPLFALPFRLDDSPEFTLASLPLSLPRLVACPCFRLPLPFSVRSPPLFSTLHPPYLPSLSPTPTILPISSISHPLSLLPTPLRRPPLPPSHLPSSQSKHGPRGLFRLPGHHPSTHHVRRQDAAGEIDINELLDAGTCRQVPLFGSPWSQPQSSGSYR